MASTINGTSTGSGGLISTGDDSGILNIQTNETTAITVDTSQNVGIGTSSPSYKLHVVSNSASTPLLIDGGTNTYFGIKNSSQTAYLGAVGTVMYFENNGSERMRIDSSGNLLVGTTTALGRVTIVSSGTQNNLVTSTGGTEWGISLFNQNAGTQYYQVFRYGTSGSNVVTGSIQGNNTNTTYATSSDYRLKENVKPMQNALAIVTKLKPCTYTWKVDGSDGQGFIAHELAEVVPECVVGEKDALDKDGNPDYQGVDTSFLVATLTAALQETKALLDTQAETINALTARIVALEQA